MLHVLRVGCPWRDMHERYGKWNSVYVRFRRWAEQGGVGRALGNARACCSISGYLQCFHCQETVRARTGKTGEPSSF
ncbi:transposase [Neorhizobium galegae]|nr:transposase [Neorhizobium galegae]MCQ1810733.1 transposase [Neorhizobium galegae]